MLTHCIVVRHVLLHEDYAQSCANALIAALCVASKTYCLAYSFSQLLKRSRSNKKCASRAAKKCLLLHLGSVRVVDGLYDQS